MDYEINKVGRNCKRCTHLFWSESPKFFFCKKCRAEKTMIPRTELEFLIKEVGYGRASSAFEESATSLALAVSELLRELDASRKANAEWAAWAAKQGVIAREISGAS